MNDSSLVIKSPFNTSVHKPKSKTLWTKTPTPQIKPTLTPDDEIKEIIQKSKDFLKFVHYFILIN